MRRVMRAMLEPPPSRPHADAAPPHQDRVKASAREAVADAGVGADVARRLARRLDLAAQVRDVRAQHLRCRRRRPGPRPRRAARGGSSAGRGCRASARSRPNSIGVRWTSAPSRRDRARREVDHEVAGDDRRLVGAVAGAPQHRLQPRDELARRERLDDVVVGAGLERADLLLLVADRAESTMIGIALHSRSARQTSMPSPSGSTRSRIAASGGWTAARSSASCAVSAGTTSKPASRSTTRSARRICGSSSQTSTRRAALTPATGLGQRQRDDEARALARAATRRGRCRRWPRRSPSRSRARARSPRRPRRRGERLEDPLAGRRARCPGRGRRRARAAGRRSPAPAPRPARRRAWRPAFSSRFANARSSCAASARISGRSRSTASRTRSAGSPASATASRSSSSTEHQSRRGSAAPACSRDSSSSLSIEPRQPGALARDAGRELGPLLLRQRRGRQRLRARSRSRSAGSAGRARPRAGRRS